MSSDGSERPTKKAKSTESSKENAENSSSKIKVCRLRIHDVESKGKYGKDCFLSLLVEQHGLYDLVEAMFQNQLHELSGGDSINSHLWKVKLGANAYDSDLLLPEFGSVVCNEDNPRLLQTFHLKKGLKGSFRGESGKFKFFVDDVSESVEPGLYPKYQVIETLAITANVDSSYISNEEKEQALIRRKEYHDFYNGMNDWKRDRDLAECKEVYIPAKPVSPEWNHKENTVIGLFLKGGWKFKKSWTHGLQYALLHRAESATSGRWYQLRKERSYYIEYVGNGMSQDEMIIQAKKLCKSMMQATLAKESPTPRPKPKTYMQVMEEFRRTKDGDAYERAIYQRATHRNNETFDF